jgi:tetratricopeptide (TPR) repeat protein
MTAGALALLALLASAADAGAPDAGAPPAPRAGEIAKPAPPAGEGASPPAPPSSSPAPPPAPSAATRAAARADHALGLARLKAGRPAEAAELFQRAAAGDPGNAAFATDLGFALGKVGRRAEAEAALRGAIEKDPRRFYAYVNLADLLADDPARWDRRDAIVADLERGLSALKDDRKGRFNLLLRVANFERAVGRPAAARARLEPLLAADATPALTPAQRKRVLDLLDAVTLDERAHALDPWPAPVVGARARARADDAAAALAAGRAEDARAAADEILRDHPTWQHAHFLRGRALEALGRVDEAASELEIAVNLAPSSTPRPGACSAACSRSTAARSRPTAPTRRSATRSRSSPRGPTCASCAPRWRTGAPASPPRRPRRAPCCRPSTRARSFRRPRSGSTWAIRPASAATCSIRRSPTLRATSRRR